MQFICKCGVSWGEAMHGQQPGCPSCGRNPWAPEPGVCGQCHKPLDDHHFTMDAPKNYVAVCRVMSSK